MYLPGQYSPTMGQPGMNPGMDLSSLMKLMQPQAPQGPMGGAQVGPGGQLPGLPPGLPGQPQAGAGAPPSAAPSSSLGREQVADALMAKAGAGMSGPGASPGSSALGGALQGASLAGMMTGKSPMSAIKNMMAPSSPGGGANPLLDPVAGNSDPMSFVNSLNGMPENPALESAMGPVEGLTDGQIAMNQQYLDALSPAGIEEMFTAAPAVGDLGGLGAAGAGADAFGADMLASMGGEAAARAWLAELMAEGGPLAFAALL